MLSYFSGRILLWHGRGYEGSIPSETSLLGSGEMVATPGFDPGALFERARSSRASPAATFLTSS